MWRVISEHWVRSHRPHIAATLLLGLVLVPTLWFAMAYAGLPRIWSHHEHKKGKPGGDTVSYTAQDIPGDPINLEVEANQSEIDRRLKRGGWKMADPVSLSSAIRIGMSVLLQRPYPNAPVSPLYVHDRMQDMAFELDEGRSAKRRHHVRFWQIGVDHWLGSATFDRGVGLSLFTLQITHHIGPDVDRERDAVTKLLASGNRLERIAQPSPKLGKARRNGGGDRYLTDGTMARITIIPGDESGG